MSRKDKKPFKPVQETEMEIRGSIDRCQEKLKVFIFNHKIVSEALDKRNGRLKDGRLVTVQHSQTLLRMIAEVNECQKPYFRKLELILKQKKDAVRMKELEVKRKDKHEKEITPRKPAKRAKEKTTPKAEESSSQEPPVKRSKRIEAQNAPQQEEMKMPPDLGERLNRIDMIMRTLSDPQKVPDLHAPGAQREYMYCIGLSDPVMYEKLEKALSIRHEKYASTKVRDMPFSIKPEHIATSKPRKNIYLLSSKAVLPDRVKTRNGFKSSTNPSRNPSPE